MTLVEPQPTAQLPLATAAPVIHISDRRWRVIGAKDGRSIGHFAFEGSIGNLDRRSASAANGWLWQMDPGVMDETLTVPAELHHKTHRPR